MEPLRINLWLIAEMICIVAGFAALFGSFVFGLMTLPTAGIALICIAILCSVESEQRNAE